MPVKGYDNMTLRFEGDSDWIEVKINSKDNAKLQCPKGYDKNKVSLYYLWLNLCLLFCRSILMT